MPLTTRPLRGMRKLGGGLRIDVRARKVRPYKSELLEPILPIVVDGRALNIPETRIYKALTELKVRFTPQYSILGGSFLGGARLDFYLPDYKLDIEYAGPFHATSGGVARDALRNLGVSLIGVRVVQIYEHDLPFLKERLVKLLGRRG